MNARTRPILRCLAAGVGFAAGAYATYVAVAWSRFGRPPLPGPDEEDALLDRFMPSYEIAERHRVRVAAAAPLTLEAARAIDLFHQPVALVIFKMRELLLGAAPEARMRSAGLLADAQSIGWVVLGEVPDREVVLGSVTRPWEPNVTFRSIPSEEFAAFDEPDYVKIAWTLRADPVSPTASIFRSETRAVATDPEARAKFRRYWSLLSPGIIVIRWVALAPVKRAAERRAQIATFRQERR